MMSLARAHFRVAAVSLAVFCALVNRSHALATYGFSEDEINKVEAIQEYRRGHFAANAEHPMLMKEAIWGSVALSQRWNHIAPAGRSISLETAVRLPNALAGAATTIVLSGIGELLFGPVVAVAAATIWAFDVNAIAINRIGKEDSFLLFFFLLAVWCYERAKRQGPTGATLLPLPTVPARTGA